MFLYNEGFFYNGTFCFPKYLVLKAGTGIIFRNYALLKLH